MAELIALCRQATPSRAEPVPERVDAPERVERYAKGVLDLAERPDTRPDMKAKPPDAPRVTRRSTGRVPKHSRSLEPLPEPSPPVSRARARPAGGWRGSRDGSASRVWSSVRWAPSQSRCSRRRGRDGRSRRLSPRSPRRSTLRSRGDDALIDEPGVVSIPNEVAEDVRRSIPGKVYLQAPDPAVLYAVLSILESRAVPEMPLTYGRAWLENDDTLVLEASANRGIRAAHPRRRARAVVDGLPAASCEPCKWLRRDARAGSASSGFCAARGSWLSWRSVREVGS